MTDQPPLPPGNYPPPPPAHGGGYPPQQSGFAPPPQGGPGYPPPPQALVQALPKEAYTPWFTRVLAWIIDYIPVILVQGIASAVLLGTRETACVTDVSEFDIGEYCATGASTVGQISALFIGPVICLIYVIWNLGYRQGTTGSSIGKAMMKFKVVSEKTGQPLGFGMSVVREIIYFVASAACGLLWLIAVLFPLWDPKRQSLADKIVSSICLPL